MDTIDRADLDRLQAVVDALDAQSRGSLKPLHRLLRDAHARHDSPDCPRPDLADDEAAEREVGWATGLVERMLGLPLASIGPRHPESDSE